MNTFGFPDRYASAVAVLLAIFGLVATTLTTGAQEDMPLRGVAMVIGNSEYEHLPALANPANDARAVEMLLSELGFETELSSDRDARRLARDLDIFLDDAAGADVAILYYAGHGIEAGGHNFLVPVDADFSALDAAGEKLVPISDFVERLQTIVPVTIVMLDACRDNPFPAGSMIRLDGGSTPVAMGESGLGETRGATRMVPAGAPAAENFGTVIAFAAEPGRTALDGEPGGNSPYTAAVLRHLEIMAGEEFGTVMRMVAEEVYLKTAGRQRPWINESLRRLLYFGAAPEPAAGAEGEILAERRQLLITISALPKQGRGFVERVAGDRDVPMDALFAMLTTLGEDLPDDPAELDALLRRLADDLKRVLAERSALNSTDPEIVRLTKLAQDATAEGALSTAVSFFEQAKSRVGELQETVAAAEDDIRDRRVEFAEVYAGSAAARALALDHLGAAADFEKAADEVARWDDGLNWRYRLARARALADHGTIRGDRPALEDAAKLLDALAMEVDAAFTVDVDIALADTLTELGRRQVANDSLERAVAIYRTLLAGGMEIDRIAMMRRLGAALGLLGRRDVGTATLEEAALALKAALELTPRTTAPLQWANIRAELGQVGIELWERNGEGAVLEGAIAHYRAALEEFDALASPTSHASVQLGLGRALRLAGLQYVGGKLPGRFFGVFGSSAADGAEMARELFGQSLDAFDAALGACGRETYPVCWAAAEHGRAVAEYALGAAETRDSGASLTHFRRSLAAFENALSERRLDMAPVDWAETHASRAEMLGRFADKSADGIKLIYLAESARGYRDALAAIDPQSLPALWFDIGGHLGGTYRSMVSADNREGFAVEYISASIAAQRASLEGLDPVADREEWLERMAEIAKNLDWMGGLSKTIAPIEEAIAIAARYGWERPNYHRTLGLVLLDAARNDGVPEVALAARRAFEESFRQGTGSSRIFIGRADQALKAFPSQQLRDAAERYRGALSSQARIADPTLWARNRDDLAMIELVLSERHAEEAVTGTPDE